MDELEIFNRALSDEEIRSFYEAGSADKIKPGPIELHDFVVDAEIPISGGARGLIAGDVVGDGQARIIVGSWDTGHVHVFKYHEGRYTEEWSEFVVDTDREIVPTAIGDADNDGQPEFLVSPTDSGNIYVYEWNGNTYQLALQQNLGGDLMPAVIVDLDRDGDNELVIDAGSPPKISVYEYSTHQSLSQKSNAAPNRPLWIPAFAGITRF